MNNTVGMVAVLKSFDAEAEDNIAVVAVVLLNICTCPIFLQRESPFVGKFRIVTATSPNVLKTSFLFISENTCLEENTMHLPAENLLPKPIHFLVYHASPLST